MTQIQNLPHNITLNSFDKLYQLSDYKPTCPFCENQLTQFIIGNSFTGAFNLFNQFSADIHSKLNNNTFSFKINYTSATVQFTTKTSINVRDNLIELSDTSLTEIPPPTKPDPKPTEKWFSEIFQHNLCPRFESHCMTKSCKYNYYFYSKPLRVENSPQGLMLSPTKIDGECFNMLPYKKYWVLNKFIESKATIYDVNNTLFEPVNMPFIDVYSVKPSVLMSKLITILNFR